jgi:hypothetical protein
VLEGRENKTVVALSLLMLGCGSFLSVVSLCSPFFSSPAIATLIVLTTLTLFVGTGRFFTERLAHHAEIAIVPLAATNQLRRQQNLISRGMPRQESFSSPTLQTSTCICVNHQPPRHMNREEGSAEALAVTTLSSVQHRPKPYQAAVMDCGRRLFSLQRMFVRLSGWSPKRDFSCFGIPSNGPP